MHRRLALQAPPACDRRCAYQQRWNGKERPHWVLVPIPVARFRRCQRRAADRAEHFRRHHLRQGHSFDLPLRRHHLLPQVVRASRPRLSPRHCRRLDHRLRHHPVDSMNRLRLGPHRCHREAHHLLRHQAGNANQQQ
jgi:hypothetical protein